MHIEAEETQPPLGSRIADLESANARLQAELEELRGKEERLRRREEMYRYSVELSEQLAWMADSGGTIRWVSPRYVHLTGMDPTTDPNKAWLSLIHPDDVEAVLREWQRIRAEGQSTQMEFRMRIADGSYRTFRARAAPRLDERGNVINWYGFSEDVQEQKEAEAAQQVAEQRYRMAAQATDDAVWDLDLLTGEIHWSDSAAGTLGYPGRRLGTTSFDWWEEKVHPEDRKRVVTTLDGAIRSGRTRWSESYRFRRVNGDYGTVLDRGFIMRDEQGKGIRAVGAIADITERERAAEEIRRMQAELVHVSRLSAMGTMASTLAHELNQPLTAITNYVRGSRRLIEELTGPSIEDVRQALESAETGALRAGQIVRRLRELVARGRTALRPEELPKLIDGAGELAFLDAHLLDIAPSIELDPQAQWVEVDRIQIQQVLINLIRNAMQAMQDSDRREIVIRTRKRSKARVQVSVIDSGSGIPPAVRTALFTPFQGTKADGLGIGLSISRTIIEAHGGKIWAEDRADGGAIFHFTLPRIDEPVVP